MKKITIIGVGQLGNRHLQALLTAQIDMAVEIVDPIATSIENSKNMVASVNKNPYVKSVNYFTSIDDISMDQDLVIVATGANVRAKLTLELLKKKNVKNLVLEKVLFQRIEDYTTVQNALTDAKTNCWVNHTRRMMPFYKSLKEQINTAKQVSYNFQGGDWGLACNGLHFIDHLAFMVGSDDLEISHQFLDKQIYQSKRAGNIEFNGLLPGKVGNHNFSLYSNPSASPCILNITSDNLIAKINESAGIAEIASVANKWQWQTIDTKIICFQSELTNILATDILVNSICDLPTYAEAMKLHVPFINCLLEHEMNITGTKQTICKIT